MLRNLSFHLESDGLDRRAQRSGLSRGNLKQEGVYGQGRLFTDEETLLMGVAEPMKGRASEFQDDPCTGLAMLVANGLGNCDRRDVLPDNQRFALMLR
jgi:hypothetical protein